MHSHDDDGTPAHLRQLDKTLVDAVVAKLKPMPLGFGGRLELNAFAETRAIHDGRRLLNLLRYMVGIIISADVASVMSSAIADLELMLMLPKDG